MNFDINSMKNRLLIKYPLFGSIVANLNYIETRDCLDYNGNPTAGTDGSTMYYHPDFINSLSEDEQTFVFAHEICHIAFDHIDRSEGKDKKLWNIATDAVSNAFLKQDGLPLPNGGVDIPDAINYTAEEMYEKLLSQKQQKSNSAQNNNQQKGKQESSGSSSQGSGEKQESENKDVGHDTHSMWNKKLEDKNNSEQSQNKSESSKTDYKSKSFWNKIFHKKKEKDNEPKTRENKSDGRNKSMQEQIKKISEMGEKKAFNQNRIERRKQLEELRHALAQQSTGYGSSTNSITKKIEDIGISAPLIDWRRLLKEAVKVELDWSYRNASIEDGVVTPHLEEISKPETEILLDTSYSVSETLLKNFLRECKNILQNSKVKVGCFDTEFYGFHEIRNENDIDNMEFQGFGGTDFDVAVNAFSRRVENKIIFTDGDAPMPDKVVDAIWIVFGGKKINPKGGKVIHISDEDLNKLCFLSSYGENRRKRH